MQGRNDLALSYSIVTGHGDFLSFSISLILLRPFFIDTYSRRKVLPKQEKARESSLAFS